MSKDDFFEQAPQKRGGKAKQDKRTQASKKASGVIAYTVNLYLAIGLVVAAFAVGFFVGGMVLPAPEAAPPAEQSTTPSAPPLTEEQINQGQMPAGHPQVTPGETTTPSETDTPSSNPAAPSQETTP